jgi:hypothetical protein
MSVRLIEWVDANGLRGFDLHVLRGGGASVRLDQQLVIFGTKVNPDGTTTDIGAAVDKLADDALKATKEALGVTKVEFVARLNKPADIGVTVDPNTGVVTASAATPLTLRNFLVAARVQHNTAVVPNPLETFIRVHLHSSVRKVWLTPSSLTVHQDSRDPANARFPRYTVLAQFDDEIVGDISEAPGIVWGLAPGSGGRVEFSPQGGIKVRTFPGEEAVQATLPAPWSGMTAQGKIMVRGPWADLLDDAAVTLLSGPGFDRLSEVPNVLFIPDGFEDTPDDRNAFDKLLHSLLDWLRTSWIAQPYNLFFNSQKTNYSDSINFWSVFLPSRERAASLLPEMMRLIQPEGGIVGDPLPTTFRPPATGAWSIEHLIFQVGLPVPADVDATLDAKEAEWRRLFGGNEVPPGKITQELFNQWTNLTLRTLANERDTVLATCAGERPRVMTHNVARALGLHRFRTQRSHLDQLLERLTDSPGGPVIGKTWTTGKDRELVFALVSGAPSLGAYSPGQLISTGLGTDFRFLLKPVDAAQAPLQGSRAIDVTPYPLLHGWPLNVRLPTETIGIIVHELSHAFGLGDEYGHDGFRLPDDHRRFLVQNGNVQPESELESAPQSGDLDGGKLRWRWPRIKQAAVLADRPVLITAEPSKQYVISLRPGQKHFFQPGEIVFLRQRPLLKAPSKQRPTQVNPAKVSGPMEVVSAGLQVGEQIVVKDLTGTLDPADFPANEPETAIVFAPHAVKPAANDAELVAKVVREHIKSSKRPLNRAGGHACSRDDNAVQTAVNTPANLKFPGSFWGTAPLSGLVGAFDGGSTFYCGIYHPSGECLMRSSAENGEGRVTHLCPVCQYLLVDRIDPSLHGPINKDYENIYPAP